MFQPGADWDGPPMAVLLNKADALLAMAPAAAADGEEEEQPRPPRPRAGEGGGGWGGDGEEQPAPSSTPSTTSGSSPKPPPPEGGEPENPQKAAAAAARLAELEAWYRENCRAEAVFVGSARRGAEDAGVAAVRAWAVSRLPEGPTLYPKAMASDQPERFFVAEIIREAIFAQYGQEIPYAAQVQVEEFRERGGGRRGSKDKEGAAEAEAEAAEAEEEEEERGGAGEEEEDLAGTSPSEQQPKPPSQQQKANKDYIAAAIVLERESQVAIVVGSGGKKLRRLGAEARREIEGFLGRPVYLDLTVRAAPGWRESPERLREFGYYSDLYM
jgi:hypothetical protein